MSVSLPLSGCSAALAMKYAEASQDIKDSEPKDSEIGPVSVAIKVISTAARKPPTQMLDMMMSKRFVLGSSTTAVSGPGVAWS